MKYYDLFIVHLFIGNNTTEQSILMAYDYLQQHHNFYR